MFTFKVINYTNDCFTDEEDRNYTQPPMLRIKCYLNESKLFEMISERGPDLSDNWLILAEACKNEERHILDWGHCNGEFSITVDDDIATFEVAKYGDGNGGSLFINIPAKSC